MLGEGILPFPVDTLELVNSVDWFFVSWAGSGGLTWEWCRRLGTCKELVVVVAWPYMGWRPAGEVKGMGHLAWGGGYLAWVGRVEVKSTISLLTSDFACWWKFGKGNPGLEVYPNLKCFSVPLSPFIGSRPLLFKVLSADPQHHVTWELVRDVESGRPPP